MKRTLILILALALLGSPTIAQGSHRAAKKEIAWVLPDVGVPHVTRHLFSSETVGGEVSYFLYTPEAYGSERTKSFPVLYWLHGSGGGEKGIGPVVRFFEDAIQAKKIQPMLIVFPNGLPLSLWVDSKDGRMPVETVFMEELLPEIESHYRVIDSREGRLLEGFSMGGYGVARLAFRYPETFAAASILSGGPLQEEFTVSPRASDRQRNFVLNSVFGGDPEVFREQSPWRLAETRDRDAPAQTLRVVIGARDEMLDTTILFHDHLIRLSIRHAFKVLPGVSHKTMEVLEGLGETNWAFYREAFGKE